MKDHSCQSLSVLDRPIADYAGWSSSGCSFCMRTKTKREKANLKSLRTGISEKERRSRRRSTLQGICRRRRKRLNCWLSGANTACQTNMLISPLPYYGRPCFIASQYGSARPCFIASGAGASGRESSITTSSCPDHQEVLVVRSFCNKNQASPLLGPEILQSTAIWETGAFFSMFIFLMYMRVHAFIFCGCICFIKKINIILSYLQNYYTEYVEKQKT